MITFQHVVFAAVAFRAALIVYAEYHDAHSVLKYTDVDYRVFSDAARFVAQPMADNHAVGPWGESLSLGDPYTRETYRYTPLLALLLLPNEWLHPAFGKVIFSLADIGIGLLSKQLLVATSSKWRQKEHTYWGLSRDELILAGIWLLNPMPANISTRGSAESLLGILVILTLALAVQRKWVSCAILLGASIHWKIYPLIYVGSLLPLVGAEIDTPSRTRVGGFPNWVLNPQRLRFVAVSAATFALLSGAMYMTWGMPFLEHSYLYHIGRTDHRHNFSVYFYPLYLGLTREAVLTNLQSKALGLLAFLPQMTLSIGSGFYLSHSLVESSAFNASRTKIERDTPHHAIGHLPFVFFLQTMIFVTLNKVCTSQYFMWYWWFLPLIIPRLIPTRSAGKGIRAWKAVFMVGSWFGAQALWLSQGYTLEFLGETVFLELWMAGLVMLGINSWLIVTLVKSYQWEV